MNPIRLALLLILLLAKASPVTSGEGPSLKRTAAYQSSIANQMKLKPEEVCLVKNQTIRFYFLVDSSGQISQVVAVSPQPKLKLMLEERFKKIRLPGFPANTSGKVDVKFLLN